MQGHACMIVFGTQHFTVHNSCVCAVPVELNHIRDIAINGSQLSPLNDLYMAQNLL